MKVNTVSKFIRIRCKNCKNEQVIFEKASTVVKCLVCSNILAVPTGGKIKGDFMVLEVLD